MPKYHINVFFSADDGCWVADIPDLKFWYLFSAPHSVPRCETGAAERGPSR